MSVISIQDLSYAYQDGAQQRFILSNVSYDFEPGRFYAILGNSGSGKTTLLSLMGALDTPRSGAVIYKGTDIRNMGFDSYRRNHVGIVFQSYNLIPWLTAVENVLIAMDTTDNELPKDQRTVATNLLGYLGIDSAKATRRVPELSGGEQQRVAIARALATNVDLILADEPTGNLDEASSEEIVQIFRRLADEHGKCVVVVTHDTEIARNADAVLRLYKGVLGDCAASDVAAAVAAPAPAPAPAPASTGAPAGMSTPAGWAPPASSAPAPVGAPAPIPTSAPLSKPAPIAAPAPISAPAPVGSSVVQLPDFPPPARTDRTQNGQG
ncbi:MAG: ABC transporter ATP-binding protein [Coriobacteriales bacterium]|jgi:putative ABC transport system ATP-binding protein|nr:ABC transporter ATP-binding protein [Coriobacteriales bacterium]